MKKLLGLVLFMAAYALSAQTYSPVYLSWQPYRQSGVVGAGSVIGVKEEGGAPFVRSYINFLGASITCADDVANDEVDCTVTGGGGGLDPTGISFLTGAASAELDSEIVVGATPGGELGGTWASPTIDDSLSVTGWTLTTAIFQGAVTFGNGATGPGSYVMLEDTDNGAHGITTIVPAAIAGNVTYTLPDMAAASTYALSVDTYPGIGRNPRTTIAVWDEFGGRGLNAGAGGSYPSGGGFGLIGSGASSGWANPVAGNDGTAPGIARVSTGTTGTGGASIVFGHAATGTGDSVQIQGGEIVEYRVYIPTASNGTDTHEVAFGFGDVPTAGGANDALYVYWDNNASDKWGCHAEGGNTPTANLSTTVATAGAWHVIRVEVNADATSVAYKVDGVELSCSPYAGANIPTGASEQTAPMARIKASSNCAAVTTCVYEIDYAYFYKPGLTR